MTIYIWSLFLGAAGLLAMAASGLGRHGGHSHGHGHAGHGGHAAHGGHAHAGHGHGQSHAQGTQGHAAIGWLLNSPRMLFSVLLGLGTTGELLKGSLSGPLLFLAALAGGVLFERFIVTPIWDFAFQFASRPAATLESAVTDEGTAVTGFDVNGEGIVSIEVDGQIVQCLARLRPDDRSLGTKVRAGQRLRIEDVNTAKNRCTVSVL